MGNKIVSIAMTIFMLLLCVLIITTASLANMKRSQNLVVERAENSILSTDGADSSETKISLRGSSLISSITGVLEIDERIPNQKEKIYSYKNADDTESGRYIFVYDKEYGIEETQLEELIGKIEPLKYYTLEYSIDDISDTHNSDVDTIKVIITEESGG